MILLSSNFDPEKLVKGKKASKKLRLDNVGAWSVVIKNIFYLSYLKSFLWLFKSIFCIFNAL